MQLKIMKKLIIIVITFLIISKTHSQKKDNFFYKKLLEISNWKSSDSINCYVLKIRISHTKQIEKLEVYFYMKDSIVHKDIDLYLFNFSLNSILADSLVTSSIANKKQTIICTYVYKYMKNISASKNSYILSLSEFEKMFSILKYVNNMANIKYIITMPIILLTEELCK